MTHDPLYQKIVSRWEEVTQLPPQQVGVLTPLYKRTVRFFKVDPWRILMPASFILAALVALVLQVTTVQIASFLQRGF